MWEVSKGDGIVAETTGSKVGESLKKETFVINYQKLSWGSKVDRGHKARFNVTGGLGPGWTEG